MKKKVLWQRFWLDLCILKVVSARACAQQFLAQLVSYYIIWQENCAGKSCFNSEQIDTLFISVGG